MVKDTICHLLHLTTGLALDNVVTSAAGQGLQAWSSLVARWDPKQGSRSAGILLELVRFDFSVDLLSKMEEYDYGYLCSRSAENARR